MTRRLLRVAGSVLAVGAAAVVLAGLRGEPSELAAPAGDHGVAAQKPGDGALGAGGLARRALLRASDRAPGGPEDPQEWTQDGGGEAASSGAPAWSPEEEARLREDLRLTDEALDASRRLAERFVAAAPADRGVPGAGGGPGRPVDRPAGRPAVVHACGDRGATCLGSADCCSGLVCAGGVAGFGTRGTCRLPR